MNNPKEKKEMSNVIIYLCMFLLLLIIALPPIMRTMFPKDATQPEETTTAEAEKIVLLTCSKKSSDGSYTINSRTRYIKNEVNSLTLTYQMTTETDESQTQTPQVPADASPSPSEEATPNNESEETLINDSDIVILRGLVGAEVKENENNFTVIMNRQVLEDNSSIDLITNYFNKIDDQTNYYESQGFTCNKVES